MGILIVVIPKVDGAMTSLSIITIVIAPTTILLQLYYYSA